MHRVDTSGNVAGMFTDGGPGEATVVDDDWLNDVQETLARTVEAAGITLVKGTYTQLTSAIGPLARTALQAAANTWALLQTFSKGVVVNQSTANGDAITGYGNGTGRGGYFEGGASGVALDAYAASNLALRVARASTGVDVADIQGYVNLSSGFNPASTTAFTNRLTKKHVTKAWGRFKIGNGAANGHDAVSDDTQSAVNIASVILHSGGTVTVTLAAGVSATTRAALTFHLYRDQAAGLGPSQPGAVGFAWTSTTVFELQLYNFDNTVASCLAPLDPCDAVKYWLSIHVDAEQ